MPQDIIALGEERMNKTIAVLERFEFDQNKPRQSGNFEQRGYRLIRRLRPINQISSISIPEAQTLMIKPYDRTALKDIEKAIQLADLNLVPVNDGNVIGLIFRRLPSKEEKTWLK